LLVPRILPVLTGIWSEADALPRTCHRRRSIPDPNSGHQSVLGELNREVVPLVCHLWLPLTTSELAAATMGRYVRKVASRAFL
jgi:hypothetical protein